MNKKLSKEELDNRICERCGYEGFRIIDKRNNKTVCITCGFVLLGESVK